MGHLITQTILLLGGPITRDPCSVFVNFKRKHDNKGIGNNLNQNRSHKVFINIYSSTSSTLINYNLLARKLFTHDCNVSTSNVM